MYKSVFYITIVPSVIMIITLFFLLMNGGYLLFVNFDKYLIPYEILVFMFFALSIYNIVRNKPTLLILEFAVIVILLSLGDYSYYLVESFYKKSNVYSYEMQQMAIYDAYLYIKSSTISKESIILFERIIEDRFEYFILFCIFLVRIILVKKELNK